MRKDMDIVLFECLRQNRGPMGKARRSNLSLESRPRFEGIRRPHPIQKWLSFNTSPLERWLCSHVGDRWDRVYSEFRKSVGRKSSHYHLCEFLNSIVLRDTFMRDGIVWHYAVDSPKFGKEEPIHAANHYRRRFYVHPVTKCLCELKAVRMHSPSYPAWCATQAKLRAINRWLPDGRLLHRIEGIWYEGITSPWQPGQGLDPFDNMQTRRISESEAKACYGRPIFCTTKRQLSHRELRRHQLANAPTRRR